MEIAIQNNFIKSESILEYKNISCQETLIQDKKNIFVCSSKDKWIFPGKPKVIHTGLKIYLPENSIGLLTRYTGLNINLEVLPQITTDDCVVYVRNIGILPIKIHQEEVLAKLTIVPTIECHVINTEGSLE